MRRRSHGRPTHREHGDSLGGRCAGRTRIGYRTVESAHLRAVVVTISFEPRQKGRDQYPHPPRSRIEPDPCVMCSLPRNPESFFVPRGTRETIVWHKNTTFDRPVILFDECYSDTALAGAGTVLEERLPS